MTGGDRTTPGGTEEGLAPRAPQAAPSDHGDRLWGPGDVIVIDADAGSQTADGEPRGMLFVIPQAAVASEHAKPFEPTSLAGHDSWLDPVACTTLPDGSLAVLESRRPHADGGRGGLDRVDPVSGEVGEIWHDARARQPVGVLVRRNGTMLVVDRSADPTGLDQPTGCVFVLHAEPDGSWSTHTVHADAALVTPGSMLELASGRVVLMDADANPRALMGPDGRPATPGVLFGLAAGRLETVLEASATTSPVALAWTADQLYVLDANESLDPERMGDGALFVVDVPGEGNGAWAVEAAGGSKESGDWPTNARLRKVLDTASPGIPGRVFVDPAGLDTLPDGRLVIADANADPLVLGADGHGRGVYATGRGAVLVVDPTAEPPTVRVLAAGASFVSPLGVHVVRAMEGSLR